MYQIIADMHTHSIASTHAYSTITEMVTSAAEKGLYAIAITDHSSLMPGSPGPWYFRNFASIPLQYKGVLTVLGTEANVIDFEGNLDVDPVDLDRIDWVVASIHDIGLPGLSEPNLERSTNMWMQVAKNPRVNVIGHSGDPNFAYDYDKVIPEFGKNGKLVEINAHSANARPQNMPNCKKIALACKKYGVPLLVSSDAHFEAEVASFGSALLLLEEIDFPESLIVNASEERLLDYLKKYSKVFQNRA